MSVPAQIARTRVSYNYLHQQFDAPETEAILDDLRRLVATGEFTIGPPVLECERRLAEMTHVKHVVSTNSGTDALILALRAMRIGPGDEVITQTNTFYATVGAIVAVGAKPVLVDVDDQYAIDAGRIQRAITPRTKALLPVDWTGLIPDMPAIIGIAQRHGLRVLEDACPAVGAALNGQPAGSFGDAAAISMHPLKPLHVWGDGGAVLTNDDALAEWMRMFRNHGMINRDEIAMWGVNNRLQSVQAVVANRVLGKVAGWIDRRIAIARCLDAGLRDVPEITLPPRPPERRNAFQLYIVRVQRRAELLTFLHAAGIEARVHYPIPLHLQQAARELGYQRGDFPVAEAQADDIVTLPAHQYVTEGQMDYMLTELHRFYCR